ncbi:MAG TPA: Mpo1-like protein [Xanthomonadales bacterium]|nr:Mpo1-like protein [Xanthomonadales bacterium]
MRNLQQLLYEYGDSHVNRVNKLIHWLCVPPIVWSVVALLWSLPFPAALQSNVIPINWATLALVLAQVYYYRLSVRLGSGILLFNLFLLWLTVMVEAAAPWPLWQVAAAVFVLAWIGQFIGHLLEGKRPSFFKDLQFLLIGPAWLMSFVYKQLGLNY